MLILEVKSPLRLFRTSWPTACVFRSLLIIRTAPPLGERLKNPKVLLCPLDVLLRLRWIGPLAMMTWLVGKNPLTFLQVMYTPLVPPVRSPPAIFVQEPRLRTRAGTFKEVVT